LKFFDADPDPGSRLFDPWIRDPGWVKKSRFGSGIRDEHPESYFRELRNHFFGLKIFKFFDADPGRVKKSRSGMNIPDHISQTLKQFFRLKILKFLDANPDPETGIWIRDPDWKNSDPDKHPGSATLE
jgi:hypothetical protein